MKLAGITYAIVGHHLMAFDKDGNQLGKTTVADAIMASEQIWHATRAAAK